MSDEQFEFIQTEASWAGYEEAWGIWDTKEKKWVCGQKDFFYTSERAAKAGLSQRMTHTYTSSWDWDREAGGWEGDQWRRTKEDMIEEFKRIVKNRYVVRRARMVWYPEGP